MAPPLEELPEDRACGVLVPALIVALVMVVVAALALTSRGVDGSARRAQTLDDVLDDE